MSIKIAIDGPSGAGKSSLAKGLATKLGLVYFDTGALYRAVALYALRANADPTSQETLTEMLNNINLEIRYVRGSQHILMNSEDVNSLIRTPEVSMMASKVSSAPLVRRYLLNIQREMAIKGNVVMDGRDIGTVIMPDADIKFFLAPKFDARIQRRYEELQQRGEKISYDDLAKQMEKRDKDDESRDISPAVPADDAIFIDNSEYTPEQTLDEALNIVQKKLDNKLKKEGPLNG